VPTGPDQSVAVGDLVQLDGTASIDPDGSISSYQWVQTAGSMVDLSGSDSATPNFSAPYVMNDEILSFELTVTDNSGAQAADSVSISLQGDAVPPQATLQETHYKSQGKWVYEVLLSADEAVDDIYWRIDNLATNVTTCGLDDTVAWQAYICGPIVIETLNLNPILQWYAVDLAGNSSAVNSAVLDGNVPVVNLAPVAVAGDDQMVTEGDPVNLNGNGSFDSDGVIASYSWQQIGGPAVTLVDADTSTASFVSTDVSGDMTLTFELTVTDGQGATGNDTISIVVQDTGQDISAPVTTYSSLIVKIKGSNQHTITLTVNEPATTYYRTDPANPWVVLPPGDTFTVQLAKKQELTFYYYSVDTAGNTETLKTELLQ